MFLVACSEGSPQPAPRLALLRSFSDDTVHRTTVSMGRYTFALQTVSGLAVTGPSLYRFAVTLPAGARLRFRPVIHPAAGACWAQGPRLQVLVTQNRAALELWARDLHPTIWQRLRMIWHAFASRNLPAMAETELMPPEVDIELPLRGKAELQFEAHGQRQTCDLTASWYAKSAGHRIDPAAVWGAARIVVPEFQAQPDVFVVVIDTLRADVLPLYGGPAQTPALNGLSRDAVIFRRALALYPRTRESTFTLFAGLHPAQSGIPFWRWPLTNSERAVATVQGSNSLPWQAHTYGYETWFAGNNGFLLESAEIGYPSGWLSQSLFTKGPEDSAYTLTALEKRLADPTRVFAYVHFNQPHGPHTTPPKIKAGPDRGIFPGSYLAEVAAADESLGAFITLLKKTHRFDTSLIVITSDHGETFAPGAQAGHGSMLSLGELWVPLVIRFPHGLYGARSVTDTVTLADVAPTLRDYLGWPAAPSWGRSLLPLVQGDTTRLSARNLFWQLRRTDMVSDGWRFYLAHQPDDRAIPGIIAGAAEEAFVWPANTTAPVPDTIRPGDRRWLAAAMDEMARMRQVAWALADQSGTAPTTPRPVYVLASHATVKIRAEPPEALRVLPSPDASMRFQLVPPSAELILEASEPVRLGPWSLPFGGRHVHIATATEKRLLLGTPLVKTPPALWIELIREPTVQLGSEVDTALRSWGYIR